MIAAWMVYATVVAGLTGVAALALDHLVRPHGRPVRGIWAGAMVLGTVLPVIGVRLDPVASLLLRIVPGATASAAQGAVVFLDPLIVPGSEGAIVPLGLDVALGLLWLLASGTLVGRWLVARRRLRSFTGETLGTAPGEDAGSASSGREGVLITRETGPAVVGILRPRILVPWWLAEGNPELLALALRHEREHVAARDPVLLAASFLARVAFPWNPVLWWMARRLREGVEVDCDRRVLRKQPHALRQYADTLLTVSSRGAGLAVSGTATLAEPTSLLERRIHTMTAPRPKHPVLRTLVLGSVALAALALACSAPSPEEGGNSPTEPNGAVASEGTDGPGATAGAAGSPAVADIAAEPTFTPYTVRPEIKNRYEVQAALVEEYPPLLRDAGIGGTITVWFLIDREGRVQRTRVNESSGQEALDRAALRVAERFDFTSARNSANPVPVWISLPITFRTN